MLLLVKSCLAWLQQSLGWSNSRQSWEERVGVLGVLAGAASVAWFSTELSLAQQVLLWAGLLAALAVLLRRGWLKLFGPVLFYDLIRLGRRGRGFLFRTLYAAGLMLLLCWIYGIELLDSTTPGAIPANQMAGFAATFFYWFAGVQFVTILALTPAYAAGAIAEEKDRKTLEFLLATDLRNREIVLSKLASRLASLALILLTGLPVLSLLQFLGGVDPNLVLAVFTATGLTLFSLAGLSLLISVWARKPREAIALTYLGVIAYAILSGSSWLLLIPTLGLAQFPSTLTWTSPITVETLVYGFNAGNPIAAIVLLETALSAGGRLDDLLPTALRNYALFHGLVGGVSAAWAVARVRAIALAQMQGDSPRKALRERVWRRPRVGQRPMLWKEVYAEPGVRLNWFGRVVVALLVLTSLVPAFWITGYFLSLMLEGDANWARNLSEAMNAYVRVAGTLVACLLLLAVAVRAASALSSERDRQTLDSLLTSPLEGNAILWAKWVGSIASVRWALVWLGVIWLFGILTGGLHPLSLFLLAGAWLVYGGFVASLGLWFSLVCRTTLRATVWTVLLLVFLSVGHWFVLTMCFYMPVSLLTSGIEAEMEWVPQFHLFGLTPPFTLGFLALQGWEFEARSFMWDATEVWKFLAFAVIGLGCWAVAALVLYALTSKQFLVVAHRVPLTRPPLPGPARAPSVS